MMNGQSDTPSHGRAVEDFQAHAARDDLIFVEDWLGLQDLTRANRIQSATFYRPGTRTAASSPWSVDNGE
jgi:hypothetical protein